MTRPGSAREVFGVFLGLGLTSFGGPVAHLGYFREAFVVRRKWLGERAYADVVALCQFLPGPASSQVGMAIGLHRAGLLGMVAAWAAFTLPSALLLVGFAYSLDAFGGAGDAGWMRGLQAAAVGVVAHAVYGMARTLTPDLRRITIAVGAAAAVLIWPGVWIQVAVIVAAGAVGWALLRSTHVTGYAGDALRVPVSRRTAAMSLAVFAGLLIGLPFIAAAVGTTWAELVDGFYRAGSLVFGGGHVVLPLLQAETVPGLVDQDTFLAGYGAAQVVPGPLFTFAAFLGAAAGGFVGAGLALVAIFVPAALLVLGALPFWEHLRHAPVAQHVLMGVNAGVVGILAAALYRPVFTEGINSPGAVVVAATVLVALFLRVPTWAVVISAGLLGFTIL